MKGLEMKKIIIVLGIISAFTLSAIAEDTAGEENQRPQRPDPETVANKMVADFDKDGNGSLNKAELGEAMQAMRAQRGPGGRRGDPDARPRGQQGERTERPQRQGQGPRGDRPDPAEMFIQRSDTNEDGELSAAELAEGLGQMNRARGNRGGPRGDR